MKNIVKTYEKISNEILEILKYEEVDNDKLDICFEKREALIEKLDEENNINKFKKLYKEYLYNIDKEIQHLLQQNINKTKNEIIEYRKNQNVNFAYVNMNKLNLNIFSKKV